MPKKAPRSNADDTGTAGAPPRSRKTKATPESAELNRPADGPEAVPDDAAASVPDAATRVQQAPGDAAARITRGARDAQPQPSDEEIRARAYQMYLERGGHDGQDFDDWLRAELELRKRR